jgi:hypothetical protein
VFVLLVSDNTVYSRPHIRPFLGQAHRGLHVSRSVRYRLCRRFAGQIATETIDPLYTPRMGVLPNTVVSVEFGLLFVGHRLSDSLKAYTLLGTTRRIRTYPLRINSSLHYRYASVVWFLLLRTVFGDADARERTSPSSGIATAPLRRCRNYTSILVVLSRVFVHWAFLA